MLGLRAVASHLLLAALHAVHWSVTYVSMPMGQTYTADGRTHAPDRYIALSAMDTEHHKACL